MKVLLATDGLEAARDALALVRSLTNPETVEVTVLAVAPAEVRIPENGSLQLDYLSARRSHALDVVDAAVTDLREAGFSTSGRIAEGNPGEQIVAAIEHDGIDITAVGAGSRSWLGTLLLGSCSSFVLHNSPSSVMIVHEFVPKPVDRSRRVLVAADGSPGSSLAVRTVAEVLDPGNASVRVIAVAQPPPPAFLPIPGGPPPARPNVGGLEGRIMERAERCARAAVATLRKAGLSPDHEVRSGHPVPSILKEIEDRSYDLVALGSRGLGPVRRALLGSVSEQVARYSPATLVVREPRRADA